MEVLVIICLGLSIGSTVAESSRTVVATPVSTVNQMARFSKDLQCESGTNVYVAAVVYSYNTLSCGCVTEPQKCPIAVTPRDLNNVSSACWTSSACTLNFSTSPETCSLVNATITYVCAPVNPSLTINRQTSDTGSSLTAGYSAASDPGALWVCSVEAWDCSSVDVTLTLFIRNGNDTVSYFSVPGGRLGVAGVATRPWTFQTPFNVDLNVPPGSALLNAFFTVQAERNLTVSCGRSSGVPPTVFCNVPIVSTPPTRKFGQALTAVHNSSGVETDNSTWVCVVETADCSTGAPVDVSVHISNHGDTPASFFSLDGQRVNANYNGSLSTPLFLALHLVNGSAVDTAYVHVKAKENTTLSCGWQGNTLPILFCKQPFQPMSRKFGRALTAVHSLSGVETDNSTLGCVVETADCPTGAPAPVDVSVVIRHRGNGSASFFSSNEQRLNASYSDRLDTPFLLVLNLVNVSEVDYAYISIKAMVNVSLSCGNLTTDSEEQTASSLYRCPSDQTDNSNNNNGQTPDSNKPNSQDQNSVVGAAVGGAMGGVVVIVVIIGVVIYVRRKGKPQKKDPEAPAGSKASDYHAHDNNAYDEVIAEENRLNVLAADSANHTGADGAGTSDYDVLRQKKPSANAQSSIAIYGHLTDTTPPQSDVKI